MRSVTNPYWNAIRPSVESASTVYKTNNLLRWELCNQYTWSIPDPESVAFVASFLAPRAVEVGAGTGYWAWLMAQAEIDIVAYDSAPPDVVATNKWHSPWDADAGAFLGQLRQTFHPISLGGPDELMCCADRTLFLCWPPYRSPMALRCLQHYPGTRLVYIGEDEGGSCATTTFFKQLQKEWRLIASHIPVCWYRHPDRVNVYEREAYGPPRG